jgi:hypothetical protein
MATWLCTSYELVSIDPDSTVFNDVTNCSKKAQETILVLMTLDDLLAQNKIVTRFQNCQLILMQILSLIISLSAAAVTVRTIACRPSIR